MNDHELRLGDCLGPEGLATLADKSVDHVICDPPFASEIYERTRKNPARHTNRAGANVVSPGLLSLSRGEIGTLDSVLEPAMREIARVTRRWALVFCDVESLHLVKAALVEAGMRWVRTGAWTKPDAMPQFSGDRPAQGFEACAIAHAADIKLRWNGGGMPALWNHEISKGIARPDHPCPKPIALMDQLVRDFTDPGELICDPFAGSGTTGVACKRLGRRFIGWERDPEFHAAAVKRLDATREQLGLLPRQPRPKQSSLKLDPEAA
jgi:site-specific DNA-methyltransferase (adenine-specific)